LEVDKLEELFSTKKKEEAKAEEHAKSKVINLIDLSRANNIGIMLNRLKRSPEDIKTAIIKMDAEFLNTGNLEALRKTLPNKDEIETLKNFEGDKLNVGYVEQYMFQIYDIPDLDKKIDQLLFKSTYGAKVAEIKVDLENVGKAIVEVRTSKLFIGLLKHILAIGNFLNYGSNTGSANGFSLEVIEKLKDTKGNKKDKTLLDFLISHCRKKAPELLKVSSELQHVNAAATIPLFPSVDQMKSIEEGKPNEKLTDIHSKITALQFQVSKIAVSMHGKEHDKEDPFYITIKEFVHKAEKETDDTAKEQSHIKAQFKEVLAMFFLEEKLNQGDFQTHMFFDLISKFLTTFDKGCQASDLRKAQKKEKR